MTRQLAWLALFVLSATIQFFTQFSVRRKMSILFFPLMVLFCTVFNSCNRCEECFPPDPCFSDAVPPEPYIMFDLVDKNGKSWNQLPRLTYIDTIRVLNEQGKEFIKPDSTIAWGCNRAVCFKFNETPSRETVGKFALHKYYLQIHFNNIIAWDIDTVLIAYKSDINDCARDSIKFTYNTRNNTFNFVGLMRAQGNELGFLGNNFITKL